MSLNKLQNNTKVITKNRKDNTKSFLYNDSFVIKGLYDSLGQTTVYNPSTQNLICFSRVTDKCGEIDLHLTNMAGDYPFEFAGYIWRSSEHLYLCGEFSHNTAAHITAQEDIAGHPSGYAAKRFGKSKHAKHLRQDFEEFRVPWMFFVVWTKCKGNATFSRLLQTLPDDAIIVEKTDIETVRTRTIWGAITDERGQLVGENNLGKILMICRRALVEGSEPHIDYDLLHSSHIYLFGHRLFA